jgi:hypothetical protein
MYNKKLDNLNEMDKLLETHPTKAESKRIGKFE